MADKKKVFSIEINGLKESVDAVQSLNKELDTLQSKIKALQNASIKVKVQGNTDDTQNVKVQGNKDNSPLAKLEQEIAKQRAISEAQVTEEYQKQKQELEQIKAINKENDRLNKQIAQGVKDQSGNYANTLAGQRALLSDLKAQLKYIELGTDEYEKMSKQVADVNAYVKQLEQAYGDFQRNVGNYPTGAKALLDYFKELDGTINACTEESVLLQQQIEENAKLGNDLNDLQAKYDALQKRIADAKDEQVKLNEELSKKIQINVGGQIQYYDDLKQAAKELQKQLENMYAAGEAGTKKFNDTITALGKVKTAMVSVSNETKSYIGNAKGLQDVLTIMKGFTGIASIGTGLQTLFGGQNADLDESLKKFTALSLVMQGLVTVQKQMEDQNDLFGKTLNWINGIGNKTVSWFTKWANTFGLLGDVLEKSDGQLKTYLKTLRGDLTEAYNKLGDDVQEKFGKLFAKLPNGVNIDDLFKLDEDEVRKKFGDAVANAFRDVNQAIKDTDYGKLVEEVKRVNAALNESNRWGLRFQQRLLGMGKAGKVLIPVLKGVTTAIKGLGKALVIIAILQAAIEALSWVIKQLGKAFSWMTGGNVDQLEGLNAIGVTADVVREKVKALNDELDREVAKGNLTSYDALIQKYKNIEEAARNAGEALKTFTNQLDNTKELDISKRVGTQVWFNKGSFKDMDAFKKRYEELTEAVSTGKNLKQVQGKFNWFWWHTEKDALQDFAKINKNILADLQYRISNLDFSKGEESYKEFMDLINDELYGSALANIDKLFPDEEWAAVLKKRIDDYKAYAEELLSIDANIAQQQIAIRQRIEDNNALAIANSYQRTQEQRRLQLERELKEAGDNEKLKASIRAKFAQQSNAEQLKILQQGQQARVAAMKDGLAKTIAQMKLQQQEEVRQAEDSGATKETIANINIKWNREILKAEKDWMKQIEELWRNHNQAIIDFQIQLLRELDNINRQIFDDNQQIKEQLLSFDAEDLQFKIGFELYGLKDAEEYKDKLINYFGEITEAQKKNVEDRKKLTDQTAREVYDREIEDEHQRFQERSQYYSDYLYNQNKTLKDNLEKGLITQEEYDRENANLIKRTQDAVAQEKEAHLNYLKQIDENYKANQIQNERNYQNELRDLTKSELDNRLMAYEDYYQQIQALSERQSKDNVSDLGIINYNKEKENLTSLQNKFKATLDNLDQEYIKLQEAFDNNQLTFDDFRQAKKELDGLVTDIKQKYKETDKELKHLLQTTIQSVAQASQQYVQAFSQMWSMFNDLMNMALDEQERKLDAQQELLDKEYDMLEEQYNKQEELVQKHTDNINSIEDELKNARGDRRKFLIDQLAKQQAAQQKALQTELNIQKQKEENQKKQEQLEKEQDALQKKRWEQQKKNSIVQATINTFTAVTNALALQPFWLGIAMAAVASAMGMAQVAMIASQKYYADGGLLNGKPHSQGGIKIPGTGIEVEGNEYVVNKKTTKSNLPLLNYINSQRRPITKEDLINFYDDGKQSLISQSLRSKFADGGQLPQMDNIDVRELINYQGEQDDRPVVVSVVDIINASENVRQVETLAGVN